MAEAVKGINKIMLMRPYSMRTTEAAGRLAFQTEQEVSKTRDSEAIATKDGQITSSSELAIEISLTSIMAQEDSTRENLEKAFEDNELVEFWDINKSEDAADNKYPATYYQGFITEWTESASAEDNVEVSLTVSINGKGAKGEATLTDAQSSAVQYVFKDTVKETVNP